MIFNQHIKEVALLGTSKRKIDKSLLPPEFAELLETSTGNEATLLNAITIDLFYKKAGILPGVYEEEIKGEPIVEEKKTAPFELNKILKIIQEIDGPVRRFLFDNWCQALTKHQWIVSAKQVIPVLNEGLKHSDKQQVIEVVGKKGAWAIQQTEDYKKKYQIKETLTNVWEEGATIDRHIHLVEQRDEDPQAALTMLQATWDTESIQVKNKFLAVLYSTATTTDIPFLVSLHRGEFKSTVKEKAKQITGRRLIASALLTLPDSDLHKHTIQKLKQYVQLPEGKNFFKKLLSNPIPKLEIPKTTDDFWNPLIMTGVFGFEGKNVDVGLFKTDALYWFSCFVEVIPLSGWNEIFGFADDQCLEYFTSNETFLYNVKGEQNSCLIPALKTLAVAQEDVRIARYLLELKQHEKDTKLLYLLSPEQWEAHIIKHQLFFESAIIRSCKLKEHEEWSKTFSEKLVMSIVAKLRAQSSIYDYQIGQYAAMRFNENSIPMLEKINATEISSLRGKTWWERHFYEPIIQAANVKLKLKKYTNGNA